MKALLQSKRKTEKKGRGGDEILAHLTPGEIVIPRAFAEDYEFRTILTRFFKENKADLRQFIVADSKNKVNPKTGYLEFGWLSDVVKSFKKVFKEAGRIEKQILGKVGKEARRAEKKVEGVFKQPEFPKIIPPELPSPVSTVSQMSAQAMLVGREERRRLRGRTGRAGTIMTAPGFMTPVQIKKRGLKTKFG